MVKRITLLIGVIVLILGACSVAGAFYIANGMSPVSGDDTMRPFVIQSGETVEAIADHLQEEGFIKNATVFRGYVWSQGISGSLKAGEFQLNSAMGVENIARALQENSKESNEVTITILEGWSNARIGEYLEEKGVLTKEEWLEAAATTDSRTLIPDKNYPLLADKAAKATLEGYLFPDTYRIFKDASAAQIIEKMLDNIESKVSAERRSQIAAQGKTFFEVLNLASIVEREVINDKDKRMVADVFEKRLNDGMALQSDATVNYVTGKNTPRATLEDLAIDSPYNTYKYPGLPPGPIGNPGLSAIVAVIEPEPNPYYYFLTPEDGSTIFSRTFAEHSANVRKYLE